MTLFDDYDEFPDPLEEDEQWEWIHCAPKEQAIEHGALMPYEITRLGRTITVCLTHRLYQDYRNFPVCLHLIVIHGLSCLDKPNLLDDDRCKFREVIKGNICVLEYPDGIIFLKPEEC